MPALSDRSGSTPPSRSDQVSQSRWAVCRARQDQDWRGVDTQPARPTASTCTSARTVGRPTALSSPSHPRPGKPAKPVRTPSKSSTSSSTPTPRSPTRSTSPVTAAARTSRSPPESFVHLRRNYDLSSHADRLRAQGLPTNRTRPTRSKCTPAPSKAGPKNPQFPQSKRQESPFDKAAS